MANKLWVPSSAILLVALILSLLVSLSLPFLPGLDISRITFQNKIYKDLLKEFRFGIWSACSWTPNNSKLCLPTGHGYVVPLLAFDPKDRSTETLTISAAWTRGLAAHPFATASIFIALLASLSTRHTVNLLAPLLCGFSAVMILIAFAIQIALHLHVKVVIGRNVEGSIVSGGPGFWITLVTLVLVIAAGVMMFIKRRRQVLADAGYPMLSSQQKGAKGIFGLFRKS